MAEVRTLTLPDGRDLDVLLGGGDGELALIAHHGTPGEGSRFAGWDASARRHDLRLIGFSRPGYATSTRLPGRGVADVCGDVGALADALGIDQFLSIGGSGGGPHSIACAALMPDRCLAAAALVTIAPWGAPGLDWFDGMAQVNLDEFGAALEGEATLRTWMAANGEEFRHVTADDIAHAFGDALPPVDQAVLVGDYAEKTASTMRRALAGGFDGWVDDDLAFSAPWGFELDAITRPVRIWQGELDRLVPVAHGRWLADQIPGARFAMAPGHGHLSLPIAYRDEILDDLLSVAGA